MHTNEIFIENGRFHGKKIADAIAATINLSGCRHHFEAELSIHGRQSFENQRLVPMAALSLSKNSNSIFRILPTALLESG